MVKYLSLCLATGLCLIFSLSLAAGEEGLDILCPADRSIVDAGRIALVVDTGKRGFDRLSVRVNGGGEIAIAQRADGRIACLGGVRLRGGLNRITVFGRREGTAELQRTLSVFRRDELSDGGRPPSGYRSRPFHRPDHELACLSCHAMTPEEGGGAAEPSPRPFCTECHEGLGAGSHAHGPVASGSCLLCHEGRTKKTRGKDVASLCAVCHEESTQGWASRRYGHGPTVFGLCTTCHDPHGSGRRGLLRQDATDLCLSCHFEVATRPHLITTASGQGHPVRGRRNPARPDETFSCSSCHDPHAGDDPLLLRGAPAQGRMGFCLTCHKMP